MFRLPSLKLPSSSRNPCLIQKPHKDPRSAAIGFAEVANTPHPGTLSYQGEDPEREICDTDTLSIAGCSTSDVVAQFSLGKRSFLGLGVDI